MTTLVNPSKGQKKDYMSEMIFMRVYIVSFFLFCFRDNSAKLWDVSTGQCLRTITHTVDVRSVFFNSYAIFTGDEYTDLFMWDFAKCADSKVPDTKSNDGFLLRTLTGHNGLVHRWVLSKIL